MPSPFPGMDPYLEGTLWADLHARLIVAVGAAVERRLPDEYSAVIDQYLWLETDVGERELYGPADVHVRGESTGGVAVAEPEAAPITLTFPAPAVVPHRFLRVADRSGARVVTVVELLSPANKSSGRGQYLAKRDDYFTAGANLVEIDLLRGGNRLPLGRPTPVPNDYYYLVARAARFPRVGFWPFGVRDAFPELRIPLDPGVPDVILDLKAAFDGCYADARYDKKLDYRRPPDLPLRPADAAWAAELLSRTR